MSEIILIGRSRKTGKWSLLCDPAATYDEHNRVYRQIAQAIPVNDDYSKVLFGRIQNTNTPLTLITSDEKKQRDEQMAALQNNAASAGKNAEERQKAMQEAAIADEQKRRERILDEKNAMVNRIRRESGQEPHDETAHEILEAETQAKLVAESEKRAQAEDARIKAALKQAEEDSKKSRQELLDDKNKLVEQSKQQSDLLLKQRNQATASGPGEAAKSETPAPKK